MRPAGPVRGRKLRRIRRVVLLEFPGETPVETPIEMPVETPGD